MRDLVTGPLRTGRVVAALGVAVYLQLDPVDGGTATRPGVDVVALLDRDAVRVPIGVVMATPLPSPRPAVGAPAAVGEGGLRVPGLEVRVTRWWRSDPPRARPVPCGHAGVGGAPGHRPCVPDAWLPPDVAPAAAALGSALHRGAPPGPPAQALLGLGPGLTPAGDDVLAGALVALHHHGDPRGAQLAATVVPLLHRTTTVSAALLRQAVLGRAVPQLAAFVAALTCAPGAGVHGPGAHLCGAAGVQQDVLRRLLAVGSTSGACLAFGALAVPPPVGPPGPARPVEVW